jgi:ATP-binding cassette, subfamily C (CFTR/MRP), member 1
MKDSVLFSRVMEEYGTQEHKETTAHSDIAETVSEKPQNLSNNKEDETSQERLMQDEERLTGAVSGIVYKKYFKYAGGYVRLPIILLLLAGYQGAQGKPIQLIYPMT